MSNDFYTATPITQHSSGRSSVPNSEWSAVEAGFDLLPSKLSLQQGRVTFVASDTGVVNAYVVALAKVPPALADGLHVRFRANATNTGAATINVNSMGVVAIKTSAGAALTGGEIVVGAFTAVVYDATNGYFRIESPNVAVAAVNAFSINSLASYTAPDDADTMGAYDVSATADRKITLANLMVSGWSAITAPADAATLLHLDSASGVLKKITLQNLLVVGWGVAAAVDPAADYVLMYDASATALKKTPISTIADEGLLALLADAFS